MGLFTQAEFADLCGVNSAYITVNKKRGKLVVNADGLVDDQNLINAAFRDKRLRGGKKIKEKPESKPADEKKPDKPKKSDLHPESRKLLDLQNEKKQAEIEKMKRESRILRMKEDKLLGKLIPTDTVKQLFGLYAKQITTSFRQSAESLVSEFGKRGGLKRNDIAELRGLLVTLINNSVDSAINGSKKNLSNLVVQYSDNQNE